MLDKNEVELATSLSSVKLKNPLVLSSGILGTTAPLLKRVFCAGAGAVTTKSMGPRPREGHDNPIVVETEGGLLNTVGLPTPGYKKMSKEWKELKEVKTQHPNFVLIASIFGGRVSEYEKVAEYVAGKKPDIIELNLSCPNVSFHGRIFGSDADMTFEVVKKVKATVGEIPVMPKLSPNTPQITEIASACEEAGADIISAINTVGPGMIIDIEMGAPVLSKKKGGLSGPVIKPIALRCVYEIYEEVRLPILGIGGVTKGEDVVELMMAGASAVGIGSGVFYRGVSVFKKIQDELVTWLTEHNYNCPVFR